MEKQTQETGKTRKAGRPRRWPWILGGVIVLVVLIVLLIPVILSSRGFTQWVAGTISRSTGGQANIGNLSIGWLKGVDAADFHFRSKNGWAQVDIGRITAQPSYSSLLSGTLALDRTVIDQPRVTIDLRDRPPAAQAPAAEERPPMNLNDLARLNDLIVRDGSVQLTGPTGKTVQVADLDSTLNMRSAGHTSRFDVSMAVAQTQGPAEVRASGEVTPSRKTGWSFRGTSGNLTVDVNDLNLDAVAPLLAVAGIQVQAQGHLSANVTGAIQNGQIDNLQAAVVGRNIDVSGAALKGDRLQTSQLNVKASLTQTSNAIDVSQLNARTDWATFSAQGTMPKNVQSLNQLLESGSAYSMRANFDVNLPPLASQMSGTLGIQQGMKITGGQATGSIDTVTQNGRPVLVAKTQVAGLAGVVNGKTLNLTEPITAAGRLSSNQQGPQLEGLTVTAPFAKLNASGNFKQIKYDGQVNLGQLQSQLGEFINLGKYQLAGQLASTGQVSLGEQATDVSGSLSARQLVVASDGNSVSEPQATVNFAVAYEAKQQMLAVNTLNAQTTVGTVSIKNGTVPLGQNSPAALELDVVADNVDLGKIKPYAVFFSSFPQQLTLGGIAQSQIAVTQEKGVYHIASDSTRIQNLLIASTENEPFEQNDVTATFNVYADPSQKTIDVQSLQVNSPQIHIEKSQFSRTTQGNTTRFQGALDGRWDLAAIGQVASNFLPSTLDLVGQKQVSINFASTYPTSEPNAMLANLNGQGALGFDRATYMGLNVGPTDVNVQVTNGLMKIEPLSTTVNSGKLNFAAEANLRRSPPILTIPSPLHLVQGVQVDQQMTQKVLRYVNPIFADAVGVSGIANFDLQKMAIPLASGNIENQAQLTGTLWIDQLELGASNLLNQILGVTGGSVRGQRLTIRPTALVLQDGVLRYDDMQIDVGDNPVNFRGAIGLNGKLDMSVVLPYTIQGRTVRVGQEQQAGRLVVPLTGTIDKPELNLQKLVESQLQEQILQGIGELLKKR